MPNAAPPEPNDIEKQRNEERERTSFRARMHVESLRVCTDFIVRRSPSLCFGVLS